MANVRLECHQRAILSLNVKMEQVTGSAANGNLAGHVRKYTHAKLSSSSVCVLSDAKYTPLLLPSPKK